MKTINDYKKRIVAFVDILGFKDMVNESVFDHYMYLKIHDALEDFRRLKKEKEVEGYDRDVKVTTFSDSLVISYPIDYASGMFFILKDLTLLQFKLLQLGVFVRGGIAIGNLRHVQNEIFGPAMNEAYEREAKKAVYPRIIIDTSTIELGIDATFEKNKKEPSMDSYNRDIESREVFEMLKKDGDGWYSLDYLRILDDMDSLEEYYLGLQKVHNYLKKAVELNLHNEHVLKKYYWLANYYNEVVSELEIGYEHNSLKILEIPGWIDVGV